MRELWRCTDWWHRALKGCFVKKIRLLIAFVFCTVTVSAQQSKIEPLIKLQPDGTLSYFSDERNNRIVDFSYCGYMAGEEAIPLIPVRVVVPWLTGDATLRIQAAIDYVASLPADAKGFRGAVLLAPGDFEISGGLTVSSSGVVLRGSGMGPKGTNLIGSGRIRETLIRIVGNDLDSIGEKIAIRDEYVPVNAMELRVPFVHSFTKGDNVFIQRPGTQVWIDTLKMNEFGGETGWLGWKPGQRDLLWDRRIVDVKDNVITLDAPITTALEKKFGGGSVAGYVWNGRIQKVGIENMKCTSAYDTSNVKDEQHRWMAITMENVTDAWVRQVTFEHFAGSAVAVYESAKRVTVEDCKSLSPVSEICGQRRYTFYTTGQQTLFQRLYAEYGYHDFAVGFCAAGPNAFVQCESYLPHSFSGTIDSWASGVLFDRVQVDGHALGFQNRRQDGHGAGWTAANSVLWQCSAARIDCYRPPTANNYSFGAWGQFAGDGYWWEPNSHVNPHSLYYAQLADRIGEAARQRAHLLVVETNASSSPTIQQAQELAKLSLKNTTQLKEWIDFASKRQPLVADEIPATKTIEQIGYKKNVNEIISHPAEIINGKLVLQNTLMTGGRLQVPWWRGDIRPFSREKAKPHITRFVPGMTGRGLTDDLHQVTDDMKEQNLVALEHNYGLWYDRRRDDHERVRRMDGDVWPPFYELPFARTGQGIAWDGLSKYDLTKYNTWYWDRLHEFAAKAESKGLLLIHQHYFQHNILEAGAHYTDFPWRTANNINDTGFPEPPPYAGDKRIFMAEQFYDTAHAGRNAIHRAYIRKCLENFQRNSNVIHLISEEYTGPLHFVQFWLDVIIAWERETGKNATVGLSVTKDVQDAILKDPKRSAAVDIIDIRYWHYRKDGSLYAPKGGENLAPRQHARLIKPGNTSFEQVVNAISAYRKKYPEKAVLYSAPGHDRFGWAVLMAGGSLPDIPLRNKEFLEDAAVMEPQAHANTSSQWIISHPDRGLIAFDRSTDAIQLDLKNLPGLFNVRWFNPDDGKLILEADAVKGGGMAMFERPVSGDVVLWLSKDDQQF
jgi:hypothetical protein